MKKLLVGLLAIPQFLFSQIAILTQQPSEKTCFPIVIDKSTACIFFDSTDFEVVKKTTKLFAADIKRVTDKMPEIVFSESQFNNNIIIIGTIGKNRLIDELVTAKKLIVDSIRNQWERFIIKTIENPFPKVQHALIIAGSDRRGTAYGVFTISEAIGVSPWYWWADVPGQKRASLCLEPIEYVSKAPSVKYRGIFLNDEDWGLKHWASMNMDIALNDIGPRTYAKIFELMLRLKANYLWPAMHECTGAFNKYPENRLVADSFAIIMGSSHCEPLLFNNASEWDKKTMGEWNYKTNKNSILEQLDKRVQTNARFENVYTLALRGMHDAGMIGNLTQKEQVTNLENAINDQRALLKKYIPEPIESIPQVLIPYKEVMEIYERGLNVPDEVTLVWPDDNYGYIKRLSTPEEQKRSGHSGVYYHVSYLGSPHNYLWMSTTPPALMYEELAKAYRTGADRVWVLNVGDIKGCEFSTNLFLDMAWDISRFNYNKIHDYTIQWYLKIFGNQYKTDFNKIWDTFYQLAFIHKPEYMGWGYEWSNDQGTSERIVDSRFSFSNYNEAERRLSDYESISHKASSILADLKDELKPAFFQLVYYPITASYYINEKMLKAQQNHLYANQERKKANDLASEAKAYFDSLQIITNQYNTLSDGKWSGMMSLKQGILSSTHLMPRIDSVFTIPSEPELCVIAEGTDYGSNRPNPYVSLPCFNSFSPKAHYVDIINKGSRELEWKAVTSDTWITLSQSSGIIRDEQRVNIVVDWSKRPSGEYVYGEVSIVSGKMKEHVLITSFQPQNIKTEELKGLFVEENGYISIPAADFHRKSEDAKAKLVVIEGFGIESKAIQFGEPTERILNPQASINVCSEYDFYTFNSGWAKVYVYALPVFPLNPLEEAAYGLTVDNGIMYKQDIAVRESSDKWKENVLHNCAITESDIFTATPRKHTLKIMSRSQGMVIQKIVIDMGNLKDSYSGPESTKVL
jgi:hypothetical protein